MNKSAPPRHQWVLTEDGSYTLYSETYDENCHSTAGALGETKNYFIDEIGLAQAVSNSIHINVFETGFGLGLNFLETIKLFKDSPCQLHYVSTEIDKELVDWFFKNHDENKASNITYEILVGDARETLPQWKEKNRDKRFDYIFQDAFSPKKNPTLWEKEWFELLGSVSKGTTLITYSASHNVRKALAESGWKIENIKGYGQKRSATKAFYE